MKKTRIVIFLLVILLVSSMVPASAFAASVSVSVSSSSVKVGDTVTVKVTFKGKNIGAVQGSFSYDSSVLQYMSGNNTSKGRIVVYASGEGQSSLSASMNFRALKAGTASISVAASDIISWDEQSLGSAKVTVKSNQPAPTPKPTTKPTPKPTAKATPKPTAKVTPKPTAKVTPKPTAKPSPTAKSTQTPAPTATLTPVPTVSPSNITAIVGGETKLVVSDISGIGIPEGAERSEIDYQGAQIDTAVKFGMNLVYLTDEDGSNGKFYRFGDNAFSPYIEINQTESYIVLPLPSGEEVPEGFSAARLTVENNSVQGWVNENGQYLIYAIDSKGNKDFYSYDYNENGLQKYAAAAPVITPPPSSTATPSPSPAPSPSKEKEEREAAATPAPAPTLPSSFMGKLGADTGFAVLVCGLGLLCLALVALLVFSLVKGRNKETTLLLSSGSDAQDHAPAIEPRPARSKPKKPSKRTGKHGR